MNWTIDHILAKLDSLDSAENRAGMARYGINTDNAYGVSVAELRAWAKAMGRDHDRAGALWATGKREPRILACLTDELGRVTAAQLDAWVKDLDSWDICDHFCTELFTVDMAWKKYQPWTRRRAEYVKRAGFVLIAKLARRDRQADDTIVRALLPAIEIAAADERNVVKKAVSWALREIGKRNPALNRDAIACADRLKAAEGSAARWVGADAWRELAGDKVQARLATKGRG